MLFPLPWVLVRVTGTGWEGETSAGLLTLTKVQTISLRADD